MTGRRIRNYQLEENLGEGGMGVVYRARDLNLDRMVAIKMLHPKMLHQPDLLKRFKNEAHVTARLSHPNIATLYNFFSEENDHCLVMEFVNGKTLEQILNAHKKVSAEECIRILMQLLEGLEEAHQNEVLHRDIKPGNIMINRNGYVKLMDFGVARLESSARITRMNRVIGTLEYMAPELLTGGQPSRQTDLYSVGIAAFEMVTGGLPFQADSDSEMMERIMQGKFSLPAENNASLFSRNHKLSQIIRKLMHKKASKRYASCRQALVDLAELGVSGKVSATFLLTIKPGGASSAPDNQHESVPSAAMDAIRNRLKPAAAFIQPLLEKAKPGADQILLRSSAFFRTAEGKIISGAILFAIIILIFSRMILPATENKPENQNILQAVSPLSAAEQILPSSEERAPSLQPLTSRSDSPVSDDSSLEPERIIIPGQNQGRQTEVRQETVAAGNPTDKSASEPADESVSDSDNESKNRSRDIPVIRNTVSEPVSRIADKDVDTSDEQDDGAGIAQAAHEERPAPARQIDITISNLTLEGIFSETVSTATHQEGQHFYLTAAKDVYHDGYRVIHAGALIRGVVNEVRTRGTSRRATLAVQFIAVQAVDGAWLPISYPEYSDRGTGNVAFERGRTIQRLRVETGRITLRL